MVHDRTSAHPDRGRNLLGLVILFVVAQLFLLTTGGALIFVYVLNHGVNPAWITLLTSSLPPLVGPWLLR